MWGKAHGRAVFGGVAVFGIVAGLSGCSGHATFDSAKDLHKALSDTIQCNASEFEAAQDEGTGARFSMFECSSTRFGLVFDEDDLDSLVMRQAAANYLGIGAPEDWALLSGDNWAVLAEDPEGDLKKLQDKIGGELHKPEADD